MTFAVPLWLWAGLVACAGLAWAWRRYDARQQAALAQFVAAHLRAQMTRSLSVGKRRAKRALLLGAFALLFVALAGPQAGYRWEQVTRRGNDIIFAVDTSRSMLSPDVKPNRLTRAKLAIDDFVTQLDGDAVGLIAFAGTAFLQSPLTLDYGAFHESVNALDTGIIPRGGTNITSAIEEARAALHNRPGTDKILVLVTDGEDLEGHALTAAMAAAQQDGLKIYTVGVGTGNGELIPLPADQGGGFVKDSAGAYVKSRLDEPALKAIAAATGGVYAPLGPEGQGLASIYQQALAPLAKHDLATRQQRIPIQRYQWPLAAALGMLLASVLMGTRRRIPRRETGRIDETAVPRRVASTAAALSGLLLWGFTHQAQASTTGAARAYARGDYATAQREYAAAAQRDPQAPALQYNAGTAAYKAGQFPQAAQAFQASLRSRQSADTKRLAEQENAYYNLGNAFYRIGQKTEQSSPQQTIQNWTQAVKSYEAALQLRANDADSRFNRDLVKRKLEALQQKQPPQSSKQQNPQNKSAGNTQAQQQQRNGRGQGKDQQHDQRQAQTQSPSGQQAPNNPAPSKPQAGGSGAQQPQPLAQQGAQPKPAMGQAQPQNSTGAAANQGNNPSAELADTRRVPGQMSAEEARELLDSVKGEEQRYPIAPLARNGTVHASSDAPVRDW